jgi:hypothetical protein
MSDEKTKLSAQIIHWSIALTAAFAALMFVLTLLSTVYASVGLDFKPWFPRKMVTEIFSGVIMQLVSMLSGILFVTSKRIASWWQIGGEPFVFLFQVSCFLLGSGAFLLFSVETFRSVTIP